MKDSVLLCKVESTYGVEARPIGTDAVLIEGPVTPPAEAEFGRVGRIGRVMRAAAKEVVDVRFRVGGKTFRLKPEPGMTPEESVWLNVLILGATRGECRHEEGPFVEWLQKKNSLRHSEVT